MSKPRRHVQRNYALRQELIQKGLIIPPYGIPAFLRGRGFEEAARVAGERLKHGLPLYRR